MTSLRPEASFRDRLVERFGLRLEVYVNHQALQAVIHAVESGSVVYKDHMKTIALKQALDRNGFDAALDDERMLPYLSVTERASLWERCIRFRTLGCYPQTDALESEAAAIPDIISELLAGRSSERQGRLLDNDQSASMERKKREGYF